MKTPLTLFALAVAAVSSGAFAAENTLTAAEKSAGWQLLFDGQSLAGWRGYKKKAGEPVAGWEIKDGMMSTQAKVKGGAAIITERKFNNYELAWEWKVGLGGNNGVKYFVTEERPKSPGPEYQMIDDERHADGRRGPLYQTAAFYDVLPPAADKPRREPGQWNQSRIVVRGKTVEHWLNGKNVLTYELGSEAVKAGIAASKFKSEVGFGEKIEGHIMLTYHQDECWYRNIKVRELK
jgi:hypothetical protein